MLSLQAGALNDAVNNLDNPAKGGSEEATQIAALVAALNPPALTAKAAGCDVRETAFKDFKDTQSSDLLVDTATHVDQCASILSRPKPSPPVMDCSKTRIWGSCW